MLDYFFKISELNLQKVYENLNSPDGAGIPRAMARRNDEAISGIKATAGTRKPTKPKRFAPKKNPTYY
jgi:hypothetical protein